MFRGNFGCFIKDKTINLTSTGRIISVRVNIFIQKKRLMIEKVVRVVKAKVSCGGPVVSYYVMINPDFCYSTTVITIFIDDK